MSNTSAPEAYPAAGVAAMLTAAVGSKAVGPEAVGPNAVGVGVTSRCGRRS